MLFSFIGWIYECTYCTIKSGRWENRGFLIGPICPIYGFGSIIAWALFMRLDIFQNGLPGSEQAWWKIFIICALGTAIMEYSISLLLEKIFHAKWWDYSETPLNINGRICLPATAAFGVAGIIVVKLFFPWYAHYDDIMFSNPEINGFVALALMMIVGMDLALTEASLTSLLEILDEAQEKFDERMEAGVQTIAAVPDMVKEKAQAGVVTIASAPAKLMERAPRIPKLSWRQSYHLHSIQKFTKPQHKTRADQLIRAAANLKKGLERRKTDNNDFD